MEKLIEIPSAFEQELKNINDLLVKLESPMPADYTNEHKYQDKIFKEIKKYLDNPDKHDHLIKKGIERDLIITIQEHIITRLREIRLNSKRIIIKDILNKIDSVLNNSGVIN